MLTRAEKIMDEKAVKFSRHIRYGEANLINVLIDIARSKFYRRLDYKNLGEYCQGRLEIKGPYAFAMAAVANRAVQLKHLENALRAGRLSRCFATRVLSIIVEENQEQVVEFACTHTFDQINAYVNGVNCGAQFKERLRDLGENHHRLMCDFDDAEIDLFKRIQSIEAQANRPVSIRNASVMAWTCYLKYNCKVEKAERAQMREAKPKAEPNSVTQKPSKKRVPLTAAQKHAVHFRDKGRCTYVTNGKRCDNRHITETHHVQRVADGGTNEIWNLTTLCWFHHDLVHQTEFPVEHMGSTSTHPSH